MIRADKGTPNQNAFRTLLLGAIAAILILVGIDPVMRIYDKHLRVRPWLYAEVEIVPRAQGGPPDIIYAVHAPAYVEGRWKAWPEIRIGQDTWQRRRGGEGSGTYGLRTAKKRSWAWWAFFEADVAEPTTLYRVCVSYDVRTSRGVPSDFGPFCSDPHNPQPTE